MTNIGLIGPGAFLLAFCAVDNLLAAVMYVQYYIILTFYFELLFLYDIYIILHINYFIALFRYPWASAHVTLPDT